MQGRKQEVVAWAHRLKDEFWRNKKQTAVLCVLLVVAVVLGVTTLPTEDLPVRASAVEPPTGGVPAFSPAPVAELLLIGGHGLPADHQTGRSRREEYLARMDRNIARDLFKPNPELYPPRTGSGAVGTDLRGQQQGPRGWLGQLGEWLNRKRRSQHDRQAWVAAIRAQARALSLQSTMLGATPTALINGEMLREGDWISGFRLESIASGRCVISREGVKVVLRMSKPGR
jgi:hypothetical protein